MLRLAYLTTEYPKVSHTFIRREIVALEQLGYSILRTTIRKPDEVLADPQDVAEAEKTIECLGQSKTQFARDVLAISTRYPLRWQRASQMALAMGQLSERGMARHVAYLAEAAVLTRLYAQYNIQHVHVHFGTNAAAVARLVQCLGGPGYSMTVHGPNEFDGARGMSLGEKIADARFVVAISQFCAGQLRRWSQAKDWAKIHVVHCTVADEFFSATPPIEESTKTLLCIGRLSAQKAQLLLVEAMRAALDRGSRLQLVLAGDGEMRKDIEQRIQELHLEPNVHITGWVGEQEIRKCLLECRGLILPSFAEGLPVVLMEALAMGRPVISTMVAGIPELVKHGENGWLLPVGDKDAIVRALLEIEAADTTRLNQWGHAGREYVYREHRAETEAQKLSALFVQYADRT